MQPIQVYASFDRTCDEDLHQRLLRDSQSADSPFEVADWSGRDVASPGRDDPTSLSARIERVDVVIVLCGERTDSSIEVGLELRAAQQLGKPYFFVWGRREHTCTRPTGAKRDDNMYTWIWALLKFQIALEIRKSVPRGSPA